MESNNSSIDYYVADKTPSWIKLLQQLIKRPSFFKNEHTLVNYFEKRPMRLAETIHRVLINKKSLKNTIGASTPYSEIEDRYNLVVKVKGRDNSQSLILNTHMDIVSEDNPKYAMLNKLLELIRPSRVITDLNPSRDTFRSEFIDDTCFYMWSLPEWQKLSLTTSKNDCLIGNHHAGLKMLQSNYH